MQQSSEIIQKIETISKDWKLSTNGNFHNYTISATVYKKDGQWKFTHDGQYKVGAATKEDTMVLCFADYLISGSDYANDILDRLSATNLSVESIKKLTGLSEADTNKFIRQPQNENNAAYRAGFLNKQPSKKFLKLETELIDWEEVLKNDLKEKPSFRKDRALENKPSDIFDSWITTEVLSPNSYKKTIDICNDPKKIASLTGTRLPWEKTQKIPEGMTIYYQVYLGAIDIKNASTKLLERYKDDTQERISNTGHATTAVVTVDQEGIPIQDQNSLVLSSFPWAYGRALNNKLEHLRFWNTAESLLDKSLRDLLFETNDDGINLPLNWEKIYYAYNFLVQNCNVPEEDCIEPTFSIKQYKKQPKQGEAPKTPSAPILNSFYLSDLQRVQQSLKDKDAGKALRQYVGDIPSPDLQDLLKDHKLLESILSPDNTPAGRWPSAGRHPLVLMQQAAVNIATTTLKDGGLFSVNGPPGTGKTTLLRDIIASVIIERAKALATFQYPENAFTKKGGFYELAEDLKGHEILVASSNNNAVENISKELPQLSQISEDLSNELTYFRTISDAIKKEHGTTWGLSAVTLGKSHNRRAFTDIFWWNDDTSIRTYLKAIHAEETPLTTLKNRDTGETFQRIPLILQQEDVPQNAQDSIDNWQKAVTDFKSALHESQAMSQHAQNVQDAMIKISENPDCLDALLKQKENIQNKLANLESEIHRITGNINHQTQILNNLEQQKEDYQRLTSFREMGTYRLKKLLKKEVKNSWEEEYEECTLAIIKARKSILSLKEEEYQKSQEVSTIEDQLADIEVEIFHFQEDLETWNAVVSQSPETSEKLIRTQFPLPDVPGKEQLFSPNFTDKEQHLRDHVFVAAIKLHKAFIDGAAKPLGRNLGAMVKVLGGDPLSPDQDQLLPDLWASLSLIAPVISTTFASVTSMLRGINKESFGWLLIDEAGQGTPQAAIGAIYRSKRVVSVGDPLQIPPVTSLPQPLLDSLATHHGVNPNDFTAPQASIQTLSDKANKYGTTLHRDFEDVRIGAPLLVHRRCENPMFRISNELAYNNFMVYATTEKRSPIKDILGDSHWIHVKGTAEDKWCPEEGMEALNRLMSLTQKMGQMPDLYVISPFKIVAQKMRNLLIQNKAFFEGFDISIYDWAQTHVGTVHTFQGKEAEAVFFLLGAPDASQQGGRNWVTSQVNILNVAVSRAKRAFYIIGNQDLWAGSGKMTIFSRNIP